MSKIKNEMADRCELALMGKFVPINDNDEVQSMTEYIMTVLDREEDFKDVDIIKQHICQYNKKTKVRYMGVNTLMGQFRVITFVVSGRFYNYGDTKYTTCYCLNLDAPELSEFGDCFFKKCSDGYYHRVS